MFRFRRVRARGKTSQKTEAQLNQQAPGCCLQNGQLAARSSYTETANTCSALGLGRLLNQGPIIKDLPVRFSRNKWELCAAHNWKLLVSLVVPDSSSFLTMLGRNCCWSPQWPRLHWSPFAMCCSQSDLNCAQQCSLLHCWIFTVWRICLTAKLYFLHLHGSIVYRSMWAIILWWWHSLRLIHKYSSVHF